MLEETKRKKKVSKKSKRAWRVHTNVGDVETFLEEKRADQRLGVDQLSTRKDEELFVLDSECFEPSKGKGKPRTRAEKKIWARQPSSYQLALIPRSAVEDPIKRNRVRTKEERKHPARKAKDLELKLRGAMRQKQAEALENRKQSLKINKKKLIKQRVQVFNTDIWSNDTVSQVDDSWLSEDAKRQALKTVGEFKVKPPKDLHLPRSQLPKLEPPHPGLSYNPSLADHRELIDKVVEREIKMTKADEHLARVTAAFNIKMTKSEWMEEIMQSIDTPKKEDDIKVEDDIEEEDDSKVNIVKKPLPKMKTRKQRRTQTRLKEEAYKRKKAAVERRKTTDIYGLRKIVSGLNAEDTYKEKANSIKREAKLKHTKIGTKRLARLKYDEPLDDFTNTWDLTGSLRRLKARPTLLKDRFASMQKRNMLQPTAKTMKTKKRKVKAYVKRDHRIDERQDVKSNKLKVFNIAK